MAQWTPRQVHDTVAAIAAQHDFAGQRESLLGRFVRFIARKLGDLLDLVRGSADARAVIAVVVGLLVAIVIARIVIERRASERRARLRVRGGPGGGREDGWRLARSLADEGRFTDASHVLYAALIDSLVGAGALTYHRAKTAGDYARALRRANSPAASDFRDFVRDFERAVFGHHSPSREDFERLAAQANAVVDSVTTRRRPTAA
jgi:hypothetical protein